jgi:hypothetical protein
MFKPYEFKHILTRKCHKRKGKALTRKNCEKIDKESHYMTGINKSLKDVAKLNIPLLPKKSSKQLVLGTLKYLLPYIVLRKHFLNFRVDPKKWTLDSNLDFIECLAKKYLDVETIRLITTPSDLITSNNTYRVTAEEICLLRKYGFKFYKYNSKEFDNIYFVSKIPLLNCKKVDTSNGDFRCDGETSKDFLYF